MGLDMYLDKVRKVDKNATLKKINAVNEILRLAGARR